MTECPPHDWNGVQVPGGRYAGDNPDNVYRVAPIDPASSYVVEGVLPDVPPSIDMFELTSRTVRRFTITIGPDTAPLTRAEILERSRRRPPPRSDRLDRLLHPHHDDDLARQRGTAPQHEPVDDLLVVRLVPVGRRRGTAVSNPDGTITFVLSKTDPGVHNWVSTGGLNLGTFLLRWQGVSLLGKDDHPFVTTRLVTLDDLDSVLPAGTVRVSPQERVEALTRRRAAFGRRVSVRA